MSNAFSALTLNSRSYPGNVCEKDGFPRSANTQQSQTPTCVQQTIRNYNQNKTPFNAKKFAIVVTTKYVNAYVATPNIIENGSAGSAISNTLKNAIVSSSP